MGVAIKSRQVPESPVVDWRAGRIQDPIERLRYLRRTMEVDAKPAARHRRALTQGLRDLAPWILCLLFFIPGPTSSSTRNALARESTIVLPEPQAPIEETQKVWLVQKTAQYEEFSNGLRVENEFATANHKRLSFPVFQGAKRHSWNSVPVGIVYHTTESHLAPFEATENNHLQRIGRNLLVLVKNRHSYHFVIDRFGRVFRIVQESDAANHAGWSVWADAKGSYINLNESFLGISFEAQTAGGTEAASPAQIHASRVLTDMLRSKYSIAKRNCVTHAQVSVNPQNMRIGYHTDWAGDFPFGEMGLSDNYSVPLPSLYMFGFEYDPAFVKATGSRLWKGLILAEDNVRQQASAEGLSVSRYKILLQQRYRQMALVLKSQGSQEE